MLNGPQQCLYATDNKGGNNIAVNTSPDVTTAETFYLTSSGEVVTCQDATVAYVATVNTNQGNSSIFLNDPAGLSSSSNTPISAVFGVDGTVNLLVNGASQSPFVLPGDNVVQLTTNAGQVDGGVAVKAFFGAYTDTSCCPNPTTTTTITVGPFTRLAKRQVSTAHIVRTTERA